MGFLEYSRYSNMHVQALQSGLRRWRSGLREEILRLHARARGYNTLSRWRYDRNSDEEGLG